MGRERIEIGKLGEEIAVKFLAKKGWQILSRNYRSRWGEIDIIARDKDFVVFVEVKTVRYDSSILPQESVNIRKQSQISKMALSYLKRFRLMQTKARFDVMAVWTKGKRVEGARIELIENAFPLPFGL